ncbi:hypothetical protein C7T35_27965 [Variovorax sp. WS11]|uniref:hypothetical protein n=1 Tax=Variovorax sp. WS11 TaxID=1105204 RepID=UPI000D0DB90F|nr:hypothetical protein [Variovorax sp. WS11]NDZ17129.1 hypothetical protein [Variovorax sp. WS11]PSL81259.1 hypothetical protein C7T35_27965 [Variovorax sp. WS11]
MKFTLIFVPTIAIALAACTKQETVEAPKFDPKYVAAEADRGNLGPLTELNNACSAEVEKNGKRMSACAAQDEVRKLAKPINIRL